MGRALTEAALSGVPIVGYDYDWQREVLIIIKQDALLNIRIGMKMAKLAEKILNDQTFAKIFIKMLENILKR